MSVIFSNTELLGSIIALIVLLVNTIGAIVLSYLHYKQAAVAKRLGDDTTIDRTRDDLIEEIRRSALEAIKKPVVSKPSEATK